MNIEDVNAIGKRVKEIRLENGLNQSEFGKRLSVSQDTISLWEKGKTLPNTEFIIEMCKQFNVSANYLLGLED